MVKKEFPFDPLDLAWKVVSPKQKQTEIEILQAAEPHAALEESQEERIQLQEAVLDAFDELDRDEIWLLNNLLISER